MPPDSHDRDLHDETAECVRLSYAVLEAIRQSQRRTDDYIRTVRAELRQSWRMSHQRRIAPSIPSNCILCGHPMQFYGERRNEHDVPDDFAFYFCVEHGFFHFSRSRADWSPGGPGMWTLQQ